MKTIIGAMLSLAATCAVADPDWDVGGQTWTAVSGNIHYDSLVATGDRDPVGFDLVFGQEDLCTGAAPVTITVPTSTGGAIVMQGSSLITGNMFTATIVNGGPYDFPYDLGGTVLQLQARNLNATLTGTIVDANTTSGINGSGEGDLYLRNFAGVYTPVGPFTLEFQNITVVNVEGATPVHTLSGRITLSDFAGNVSAKTATLRIGATTWPLTLDSQGNWSVCAAYTGGSDPLFASPGWLARRLVGRDVSPRTVTGLDSALPNGDVVVSGEVDDADLTTAILNYGATGMLANHETGDANGDLQVDDADLTIVILSFGLQADP